MRKIISYNVNGIRSAISKDFVAWLKQYSGDQGSARADRI